MFSFGCSAKLSPVLPPGLLFAVRLVFPCAAPAWEIVTRCLYSSLSQTQKQVSPEKTFPMRTKAATASLWPKIWRQDWKSASGQCGKRGRGGKHFGKISNRGKKRNLKSKQRWQMLKCLCCRLVFPWVACPPLQKILPESAIFAEGRNKQRNRKIPCRDASKWSFSPALRFNADSYKSGAERTLAQLTVQGASGTPRHRQSFSHEPPQSPSPLLLPHPLPNPQAWDLFHFPSKAAPCGVFYLPLSRSGCSPGTIFCLSSPSPAALWDFSSPSASLRRVFDLTTWWMSSSSIPPVTWICSPGLKTFRPGKRPLSLLYFFTVFCSLRRYCQERDTFLCSYSLFFLFLTESLKENINACGWNPQGWAGQGLQTVVLCP